MKSLPLTRETESLAARLVWFDPPERALADPIRFMAYAFARATHEEMKVLRKFVTDAELLDALGQAPPGIIDPRSWAYWHAVLLGRSPPPPLPARTFNAPSPSIL